MLLYVRYVGIYLEAALKLVPITIFLGDYLHVHSTEELSTLLFNSTEEQKKIITTMASFHTGMKGMIKWMNKQYWSPETTLGDKRNDMVEITTNYWRAVKQVCPKIWRNPDQYMMHVAQGVSSMSILMDILYRDFFNEDKAWNITNIAEALRKSNILTTPKWWEQGGKLSKRGGNYKQLELLAQDMYMQIRKNAV